MWIDQSETAASLEVLSSQYLHERRFPDARLADQIDVREPVVLPNSKGNAGLPKVCARKTGNRIFIFHMADCPVKTA